MKKIVKPLCLAVLAMAIHSLSFSQLRLQVANKLIPEIKEVIRDYPHQFSNLRGDILDENPQSVNYACTLSISGAENASITRYSSKSKSICSWQALMLTTEDFSKASQRFKSLFTQLNNMGVKMDYGETFYLTGNYAQPVEEKTFSSVIMTFENADQLTGKMKLEISLQYEMMEWKVRLLIYEKERDDSEPGDPAEE